MRTNIDIDDELLAKAMRAGPFTSKKETVEAGLRLLERQAAYREILKWEGKLKWEGDDSADWSRPVEDDAATAAVVRESRAPYAKGAAVAKPAKRAAPVSGKARRRAGR